MKREKSLWTDCFAFLKTNSCNLPSGLNELIPLGCAARPWGCTAWLLDCSGLPLTREGAKETRVKGILIHFIHSGQHLNCSFTPPEFQIYANTNKWEKSMVDIPSVQAYTSLYPLKPSLSPISFPHEETSLYKTSLLSLFYPYSSVMFCAALVLLQQWSAAGSGFLQLNLRN